MEISFNHIQLSKGIHFAAKRAFDIVISSFMLLLLIPLFLTIALIIRITSRGPVIFRHKRIGLGGREFWMYKFRTMVQDAERLMDSFTPEQRAEFFANYKLQTDPRVTRFGRILRKTSMDELPQLLNVLKGDMSIVGPRPVTREELLKYGDCSDLLLTVNPGITGLWQVSGRSDISYEERVMLDIIYIAHNGLLFDIKILFLTISVIFNQIGAY